MKIFTIGYTKKTAQRFFELLTAHGINCVVDIRLRAEGQLSGFAKQPDLTYFLKQIANCDCRHIFELAPTDEILEHYRKGHDWSAYVGAFEQLMDQRRIPESLDRSFFESNVCCLLCSEAKPDQCHRRLVAERLQKHWGDVTIVHL